MHILVYFVNLYMFQTYVEPPSGGKPVCIQQLVLIFLFRISTNSRIHTVPPDDGPRYVRNM